MKKLVFASVERVIDYTSEQEAKRDLARMQGFVVSQGYTDNPTFGEDKPCYTVVIRTRYRNDVETGW